MNLQSSIDLDLKAFFQWWTKELVFLVPSKVRQFISDCSGQLLFSIVENIVHIHFQPENQTKHLQLTLDIDDKFAYQNLLNQYPELAKAKSIVRLTETQALAKIIYLPEATQENIAQVVGFELDRYTPFTPEQVYYSTVPLGKTGQGQIKVLVVLTPKSILDELLIALKNLGIEPEQIDYQPLTENHPDYQSLYNLLPANFRKETSLLTKSVHWLLSGLIFLLLMSVLVYPVWQEKLQVDSLKSQIKALEKDTHLVDMEQREIDQQLEQAQQLIDIKKQTPDLVKLLTELTHQLKDDTWLTNLQYSENHMQIQGQSPAASSLISLLEGTKYFSKVSFVSPLTQDKTTGLERFQISMDVELKPENNNSATEPANELTPSLPAQPKLLLPNGKKHDQ